MYIDEEGNEKFEAVYITKKSGRRKGRKRAAFTARKMQKEAKTHMTNLSVNHLKTANLTQIRRGIQARLDAYANLRLISDSHRTRKLKFAVRKNTQRTIEDVIKAITRNRTIPIALGSCTRTTGIRGAGCSPGGPLAKIRRLMVKQGCKVFIVNEAYTTKASTCCHGALTTYQRNGIGPEEFKIKLENMQNKIKGRPPDRTPRHPSHNTGILTCTNCGKALSRDSTGGQNQFCVAQCVLKGEPRPERFPKRLYQLDAQMKQQNSRAAVRRKELNHVARRPSVEAEMHRSGVDEARLGVCST